MRMNYKNLTISSKFLGDKNWNADGSLHRANYNNHIIYIYNTDTKKRTSFEFWNSITGGEMSTEHDLIDALSCFVSDAIIGMGSYIDFLCEFGFDDNKFYRDTYKMCCKSLKQFNRVIGSNIYDFLNELDNYNKVN